MSSQPVAHDLVKQIDAILPQTQCTKCGFDGCLPYAQALAEGTTDINRCPPGDISGMQALATLLKRSPKPIDPQCGEPGPLTVAVIDEEHCIGCTLCIAACPVDAIIGANKRMHTVLNDWCTGCDLCVAPCPVDCITMQPVTDSQSLWNTERANLARQRHQHNRARLESRAQQANRQKKPIQAASNGQSKANTIAAALAKARKQRGAPS